MIVSPVVFLVHDLEELATLDQWPPLPAAIGGLLSVPEPVAFGWAVAFLFLIQAAAAAWLLLRRTRSAALVFALLAGARLVNALVHLGRAGLAGVYYSGLWTAVLVVAPFGAVMLVVVGRRLGLRTSQWVLLAFGSVALQLPIILSALAFGRWVAGLG